MNLLVCELHRSLGCEVAAKVAYLVSPSETMAVLATSSSDRPMMASSSSSVISSDLAVIGRHRIEGADEVHIIGPN
jgi:hypothetical protein